MTCRMAAVHDPRQPWPATTRIGAALHFALCRIASRHQVVVVSGVSFARAVQCSGNPYWEQRYNDVAAADPINTDLKNVKVS